MALATPSASSWNDILEGAAFDAADDEQSGSSNDLVGNATNAVLQGQVSGDANNPTFYLRARLARPEGQSSVVLAIDVDRDGRFDAFIEANAKDNPRYVSIHRSDPAETGLSPSTTGWLASATDATIEQQLSAANSYIAVTSAGTDLDADGKTDGWIEFGFTFADLKDFLSASLGITTFTPDTSVAFALMTSNSGEAADGDVAGINDKSAAALTTSWTTLGITTTASLMSFVSGSPHAPGVVSVKTNDTTPIISGTWGGSNGGTDTLAIDVGGTTYSTANGLIISGTSWSLQLPALPPGTYSVTATASRAGGGSSSDTTTSELVIDTTAPTIVSFDTSGTGIVAGSGVCGHGSVVTFTLNGSEPMVVSGTPTLTLSNGATATYSGGDGTSSLVFVYTVMAGDAADADLAVTAVNGTIGDGAGNALDASNLGTIGAAPGQLEVACFAAGTHLATPNGERLVEALRIGDLVLTAAGDARPVRWIGCSHIVLDGRSASAGAIPVIIRSDALADGIPSRDLRVSPEHAVHLAGGLIPARLLVNGTSILADADCAAVTYYHVELDSHDLLVSEGAPTESYLDTGNRTAFDNGGTVVGSGVGPADGQAGRVARSCAPFIDRPEAVEPIWHALAERAALLGFGERKVAETTSDAAVAVTVGDRTLRPVRVSAGRWTFALPPSSGPVTLRSRATAPHALRPCHGDRRALGLMVRSIELRRPDGTEGVPVDHPSLTRGWWAVEREGQAMWRWTAGNAELRVDLSQPAVLELRAEALPAYLA